MLTKIGTVEMLVPRIYPLSPDSTQEAFVRPGVYDIITNGENFWWALKGKISGVTQRTEALGNGIFAVYKEDSPSGSAVAFPSPTMSRELFEDILTDPEMLKRMRFTIEKSY